MAWVCPGSSDGGFGTGVRLGPGWSGYPVLVVNDSDADDAADLAAIKADTLSY